MEHWLLVLPASPLDPRYYSSATFVFTESEKLLGPLISNLIEIITIPLTIAGWSLECFGVVTLESRVGEDFFYVHDSIETVGDRALIFEQIDHHTIVQCR